MGVMVSEIYDALIDAGAAEDKARAAAESIPISDQLATKQDIARLEIQIAETRATVWKAVIAGAGLMVVLSTFVDWIIR